MSDKKKKVKTLKTLKGLEVRWTTTFIAYVTGNIPNLLPFTAFNGTVKYAGETPVEILFRYESTTKPTWGRSIDISHILWSSLKNLGYYVISVNNKKPERLKLEKNYYEIKS